jgi:phosphate transport system ATP-binding protein
VVAGTVKVRIEGLSYWYGEKQALDGVTLDILDGQVTVLFGPAGGGKTTLMRLVNRLNDLVSGTKMTGRILLAGEDIYAPGVDVPRLRRRVGMVFALPLALPGTVRGNVEYGPRLTGERRASLLAEIVERSLTQAALWSEVKDRLDSPALSLSGGQQQRLCIARSLAVEPEVLLMDEPASALDPTATLRIEELVLDLKQSVTIVIVTHNMQQAARISDRTAFMLNGELVEYGLTAALFTRPARQLTEDYITGRFG